MRGAFRMRPARWRRLAAVAGLFAALGCGAKRPVLYPNEHLDSVGTAASERDVEECLDLARAYGADSSRGGAVAGNTAGGAAVGGATGAAVGAITGSAGRGAAAGAAAGAVGGLFRGLFRSRDPDPVFRNFVDQCLRERGYQPVGWR